MVLETFLMQFMVFFNGFNDFLGGVSILLMVCGTCLMIFGRLFFDRFGILFEILMIFSGL
jgi:hypothetical protein